MPTQPKKPLIVISYAHADEPEKPAEGEVKWLSFVTGYLRPAIKHGAVDLWIDRLMPGGADWEPQIVEKLSACDIFILLVSRHSLSSDYVVDKEIALIRERQAKGEAVHFYPLVLTPTPQIALDMVRDKNMRPRDGKPLSDCPLNERYGQMSDVANEIEEIAREVAVRTRSMEPTPSSQSARAGLSDFALSVSPAKLEQLLNEVRDLEIAGGLSKEPNSWGYDTIGIWLKRQNAWVALAVAARAALRVAPLALPEIRKRPGGEAWPQFVNSTGAVFRAAASARFAARFPTGSNDFLKTAAAKASAMAGDAAFAYASAIRQLEFPASGSVDAISEYFEIERANLSSGWASDAAKAADLAANAAEWAYLSYAANAAVSRAEAAARAARFTAATARADAASVAASAEAEAAKGRANAVAGRIAVEAVKVASLATKVLYFQEEIRTDIATIHKSGFMDAADSPLWSRADNREQSNESMADLQAVLPQGEDWEVWINWYEERLRGGSRGEVYELVFASVPLDEWDKGPAAANGWIKAHLPK
jgi:hypothetical protein